MKIATTQDSGEANKKTLAFYTPLPTPVLHLLHSVEMVKKYTEIDAPMDHSLGPAFSLPT